MIQEMVERVQFHSETRKQIIVKKMKYLQMRI